ncbi:MAG: hypothetical protein LUQ11_06165 [Methylococcaceae bacterium]|nr:hypothetical protein [Methylococcaceae bacterium]
MSLINQMLRDLERRKIQNPKAEQALEVRITAKPSGDKMSRLWLLIIFALPLAYLWYQNQASQPDQQAVSPAEIPVVSEPRQAATTTVELLAEPSPRPLPPSAPLADRSRSEPAVIAMAPTPTASSVEHQPNSKQTIVSEPAKPAEKPQTTASKQAAIPIPSVEPNLSSLAEGSRSQPPASALTERPKTAKPSTPREQAEELYRQAQRSASALMKTENLKEALRIEPSHLPARTLLLQTLMKSRDAELGEFVDESLDLFPSNLLFIKTRAHLYVQQKNFSSAVNILERVDADTVDDSAYLALLAAGYQQLQRFPQAGRIYQRLTQIQPDKAENWLGLAIAQDKLNQSQAAAQSYRQALDKKTLNAEVVSYIKQRLTALNQ